MDSHDAPTIACHALDRRINGVMDWAISEFPGVTTSELIYVLAGYLMEYARQNMLDEEDEEADE